MPSSPEFNRRPSTLFTIKVGDRRVEIISGGGGPGIVVTDVEKRLLKSDANPLVKPLRDAAGLIITLNTESGNDAMDTFLNEKKGELSAAIIKSVHKRREPQTRAMFDDAVALLQKDHQFRDTSDIRKRLCIEFLNETYYQAIEAAIRPVEKKAKPAQKQAKK